MSSVSDETVKAERSGFKTSNLSMALEFLPKVPMVSYTALMHTLRLTKQSKYWDLRTALTVHIVRSFMTPSKPLSISATQKLLNKDPGIKGRIWVSKYASPVPPETGVRDALLQVIEGLQVPSGTKVDVRLPDLVAVEAEWTGYREYATPKSVLPAIAEKEKYMEMMKECKKPTTVLYFHGGAYYLMDPATHRPTTKKIAKLTGGRCYSVRYRLAPQHPFPAALMDALVAYLTLLYPPTGAFHEPVKPEHIVFAGDSAGGNLSLALLQAVLELRRRNLKIAWFGEDRVIPLPAGVAVNSPWMDMTHTSPSCSANADYDYLPTLSHENRATPPACDAWPAVPPRKTLYVDDSMVLHPLVTLLMAQSWEGTPPVWMCGGWELLADEGKYVAGKMRDQGVRVVYEEYEAMPHCFALLFSHLAESRRCFESWTGFVKQAIEDPASIKSRATTVKAVTLEEVDMGSDGLAPYTEEEMKERLYKWCEENTSSEAVAKL